jgi:hypothetical protein
MKKALMLSAMALIVGASAAHAKKKPPASYTFGTASFSYCDGITGITGTEPLTAVHDYASCGYPSNANGLLGGFAGSLKTLGGGTWYSLINSPGIYGSPYFNLMYYVNLKGLLFDAAYESAEYGYTFYEYITDGVLIPGYSAVIGQKAHAGSTVAAALKAAKLLKK